MKIEVTSNLNVKAVLKRKGLGPDNGAQKYLAARVRLRCDSYVPKQSGTLKNTAQISEDGSSLTYSQPYAHYQYKGLVYGPNVLTKNGWRSMASKGGKRPTGSKLRHREAPMRGPYWDKRMMADHRVDIEADLAAYLNRGDQP